MISNLVTAIPSVLLTITITLWIFFNLAYCSVAQQKLSKGSTSASSRAIRLAGGRKIVSCSLCFIPLPSELLKGALTLFIRLSLREYSIWISITSKCLSFSQNISHSSSFGHILGKFSFTCERSCLGPSLILTIWESIP